MFFYRDFENKTRKVRKANICERRVPHISYAFAYLLLLAVKTSVRKVNQATRK